MTEEDIQALISERDELLFRLEEREELIGELEERITRWKGYASILYEVGLAERELRIAG